MRPTLAHELYQYEETQPWCRLGGRVSAHERALEWLSADCDRAVAKLAVYGESSKNSHRDPALPAWREGVELEGTGPATPEACMASSARASEPAEGESGLAASLGAARDKSWAKRRHRDGTYAPARRVLDTLFQTPFSQMRKLPWHGTCV